MSKILYKTAINIVPRPYKYKNITAANSIKCQDDTHYSCRIVTMIVNDEDIYYIDVYIFVLGEEKTNSVLNLKFHATSSNLQQKLNYKIKTLQCIKKNKKKCKMQCIVFIFFYENWPF